MRKVILAVLALMMTVGAKALDYEPRQGATFMGFLGMNVSSIRNLPEFGSKVGGTAGMKMDYILPNAHGTYLSTGLDWTMKGGKLDLVAMDGFDEAPATLTESMHYMEIPVRVGFRYNILRNVGVYGEVGPYFAIGVGGKNRLDVDADGAGWRAIEDAGSWAVFKDNVNRFNVQRWDCGLGFRVGGEYNNHYNLMLGCDWGFTDMLRTNFRDAHVGDYDKLKNFQFTLAFGYRF